jgi:hypothetical protein
MEQKLVIDSEPSPAFRLEQQRMALDAGLLGKLFGTGTSAPLKIAGFTLVLLIVPGVLVLFFDTKMPPAEYWKLAGPIVTGALGFVFGRKG